MDSKGVEKIIFTQMFVAQRSRSILRLYSLLTAMTCELCENENLLSRHVCYYLLSGTYFWRYCIFRVRDLVRRLFWLLSPLG